MPASLTTDALTAFLHPLQLSALLLEPHASGWQPVFANPSFLALLERPGFPAGATLADLFEIDTKTRPALFSSNTPVEPLTQLPPHTALLLTANHQQVRVKIKPDWASAQHLLLWVEPFAEDVALTQAHADFVSTVSHEFRTPLTSIKGFADTVLRYGNNLDPDQQKRFITIIKHQADRLTRLVENLLTVSKLGAQKTVMSYRPVSIAKTVERIVESIQGKLPDPREFVVTIPADLPEAWADPDKLEQVLLNLIDNAAKYSYPRSRVEVVAKVVPDQPDKLQIAITDHGVGIPESHLPTIFNKFSRIDNPLTREVEGTGLGLYITKALTNAMGGDLTVQSVLNEGSTFTATLHVATPERQAAARRQEDEAIV